MAVSPVTEKPPPIINVTTKEDTQIKKWMIRRTALVPSLERHSEANPRNSENRSTRSAFEGVGTNKDAESDTAQPKRNITEIRKWYYKLFSRSNI